MEGGNLKIGSRLQRVDISLCLAITVTERMLSDIVQEVYEKL